MTIVTDLTSLGEFMQEIIDAVPGITRLLILSDGEDGIEELDNYFNQEYEGGVTAVLQIPQADRTGVNQIGFLCSLMLLKKPEDQTLDEKLTARNDTLKLMLAIIGQLELAGDTSTQEFETPDAYTIELNVHHNTLFGVGRAANAYVKGWYVDFDLVVPANNLLYPE